MKKVTGGRHPSRGGSINGNSDRCIRRGRTRIRSGCEFAAWLKACSEAKWHGSPGATTQHPYRRAMIIRCGRAGRGKAEGRIAITDESTIKV